MKDYSEDVKKRKGFITNYEIKDNNLIIYFAKGHKWNIPYYEENEINVLKMMENQAKIAIESNHKIEKMIKIKTITAITMFTLVVLNASFVVFAPPSTNAYIVMNLAALFTITDSLKIMSCLVKKKEIEKMSLFLENKQELNDNIVHKKNLEILHGISEKGKIAIKSKGENSNRIIDINNLDNFSINDLNTIKANIEMNRKFNIEYEKQKINEEKGKTKKFLPEN